LHFCPLPFDLDDDHYYYLITVIIIWGVGWGRVSLCSPGDLKLEILLPQLSGCLDCSHVPAQLVWPALFSVKLFQVVYSCIFFHFAVKSLSLPANEHSVHSSSYLELLKFSSEN
jgi:hypothetical protein